MAKVGGKYCSPSCKQMAFAMRKRIAVKNNDTAVNRDNDIAVKNNDTAVNRDNDTTVNSTVIAVNIPSSSEIVKIKLAIEQLYNSSKFNIKSHNIIQFAKQNNFSLSEFRSFYSYLLNNQEKFILIKIKSTDNFFSHFKLPMLN